MQKFIIINGPNLNLLGVREPEIYGNEGIEGFMKTLRNRYKDVQVDYFQSNIEGEIVDKIQEVGFTYDGILLNAGGYTHTSVVIHDALKAVKAPAVEVHISNIAAREEFRHTSIIGAACKGTVSGFGLDSYRLALEALLKA